MTMLLLEYTSSPSSTLPESSPHTPPITPRCIHVTTNQDPCVSPSVDSGRPLNFHNVAFRCGLSSARLRPPTERRRTGLLANSRGSSRRTEPALDFRNVARPMVSAPSSCALSAGWQTCLLRGSWRCSDVFSRSKPLSSLALSAASASWASEDAVWHCKTPMSDLDPYGSCCHLMVCYLPLAVRF
ncbi:hypothetical protein DFH11DRAFT_1330538 [Phellopilus nigrolimitatus]|nr:hypothetical protein DFH11DRAFT_1330538 [Phellopilus nigrolimitatus]